MKFIALIIAVFATLTSASETSPTTVNAAFVHDRIIVSTSAANGEKLDFYTDTGGGWNAISESAAIRAQLTTIKNYSDHGENRSIVSFPLNTSQLNLPVPQQQFFSGGLIVTNERDLAPYDGFLGGRWFANRIWALDYKRHKMWVLSQSPISDNTIPLGFQLNAHNERTMHFPRMTITIDGEALDVLLDTGATIALTKQSAHHFNLPEHTEIGGSFIISSLVEKWRKLHPDWVYVENGDKLGSFELPMIQVPKVKIGDNTVGPVWFAGRPDKNFTEYMSAMMDNPIQGAVGGSLFKYFNIVIDYPNAKAYFHNSHSDSPSN